MISGKQVIAVVTARNGSKGLPGKNIKLLGDRPLLGWPISAALKSEFIDHVVLSTDSEQYADIGREQGAQVPFIRPPELSGDLANSTDVVLHAVRESGMDLSSEDYVVLLEPTSPLTTPEVIDRGISELDKNRSHADACVGMVLEINAHPSYLFTMNSDRQIQPLTDSSIGTGLRRQDLSDIYRPEGSCYISTIGSLQQTKSFYHERTMANVVPDWMAFEIDTPLDFVIIEAIARHQQLL